MAKLTGVIVLLLLSVSIAQAMAPIVPKLPYNEPKTIETMISLSSEKYAVSEAEMKKVIMCESSMNPHAIHISPKEESYGLVQINLLAHPDVSKEEALDPEFAIEFLAYNLSRGHGSWWSCY